LHEYVGKVEYAIRGALAGWNTPLVLAAAEPLASMFRSVNSYPRLADEMIDGNPDLMTDVELEDAAIPILDRLFFRELMPRTRQPPAASINFSSISTRLFPASSATSMAA
jgi:hypothetical protein